MVLSSHGLTSSDGIDLNEILYGTVLPIIDVYNEEEVLDLVGLLAEEVDERYRKFEAQPRWKFKRLGETERGLQHKIVWGKRQKDTERLGLEIGYTQDFLFSQDASVLEIKRLVRRAIARDRALITVTLLNAMATNGTDGFFSGAFTTEEKMTIPQSFGTNTFVAGHNHYVATGSTTLALSDLTAAREHIKHHGYTEKIWGFANANFMKKVEDLAGWGGNNVYLNVIPNKVVDQIAIQGFKGMLLGIDWKETEWMPDGYFMLVGQSGLDPRKPVAYIQKQVAAAKGLKLTEGIGRYPIVGSAFDHWLAGQVTLRGAGVVYRLATTWSDPSIEGNVIE